MYFTNQIGYMKILIDTNIFLDLYRSKKESLAILDLLYDNSDTIILTEQIVNEFYRNRVKVIREVKRVFEKESEVDSITSSFLDSIPNYSNFIQLHNSYKQQRQDIKSIMDGIISDITKDPVAEKFKLFVNKKNLGDNIWKTTDTAIERAQRRKLLGNPPTSDKYSIGDEINWEVVLENISEDIVIVGRDKTYNDNFEYLRYEYHKRTGRFINALDSRISSAFRFIGKDAEALEELENRQIEELKSYSDFWLHNGGGG